MTHSLDDRTVRAILKKTIPSFQLSSVDDNNLGLGYLYYGLARALRPRKTVVIGSKAGFAPVCFARGIADNGGSRVTRIECEDVVTSDVPGSLDFVDPSYSMHAGDPNHFHGIGFWNSAEAASSLWEEFGVAHVATHYKQTSQEYVAGLPADHQIDLLYVDGDHSFDGMMHDLTSFLPYLGAESVVLAHDVDPRCHTAQGWKVLEQLVPDTYLASRIPIYPGLALLLPARDDVRNRRFGPLPAIGGLH